MVNATAITVVLGFYCDLVTCAVSSMTNVSFHRYMSKPTDRDLESALSGSIHVFIVLRDEDDVAPLLHEKALLVLERL